MQSKLFYGIFFYIKRRSNCGLNKIETFLSHVKKSPVVSGSSRLVWQLHSHPGPDFFYLAALSTFVSFFVVQNGCLSSSHFINIPANKKGKED